MNIWVDFNSSTGFISVQVGEKKSESSQAHRGFKSESMSLKSLQNEFESSHLQNIQMKFDTSL